MFDTIVHKTEVRQSPAYPQTVIENRAPTDESIKIYAEMLAKARAEIASVVLSDLPDNVLSYAKVLTHRDDLRQQIGVRLMFKLNGIEHVVNVSEDFEEQRSAMARVIVEALLKRVGDQLWRELPGRTTGVIQR